MIEARRCLIPPTAVAAQFAYGHDDPFGRRIEKTWQDGATTVTRRSLYDGADLKVVFDDANAVVAT